ncbi:baseplate J/gp47 family protein [Variovorax sp. VNK109]|uniref:baseplate J/gp47 family protein n=1 Tax=Variovorax sp. VNK109 TaxID=3400919 RepID=UPI003BFF8FD2
MPLDRPTLPQLIDQGAAEFESRLPGVLVRVRRSLVGVLNRVIAGGLSALYQFAEHLNRQVWPDLADEEHLVDHGARWGKYRNPAVAATGTAQFAGSNAVLIPAGTVLLRADGVRYLTDADATIAAGTASAPITAETAGQAGSAGLGTALQLGTPIPGVNSAAVALTAISGGADIEDIEDWRARILARIRSAPHGGKAADYEEWALEVPGVTRVWVSTGPAAGTVTIRFARDDDASPIPDAGEVAAVQAAIDAERPVTATANVVAPIASPLNFTITLTPNSPAVQAAVRAELEEVIRREGEPGGTLLLSHLREAISIAAGETDHVLTSPSANVVHGTGQLPVMGVITWV